jgi:hypothetical protein
MTAAPPFKPGNTFGTGRPKGARNKLAKRFLEDLMADWEVNGAAAIKIARKENPTKYCLMVASLVPKELEIVNSVAAELGDEELATFIDMLRERLRASVVDAIKVDERPTMLMLEGKSDVKH